MKRINVSLDTLDADKFRRITRWGVLGQVLDGIKAAQKAGLRIKINTVALKGVNENEFERLIEWAHGEGMDLTFIEVMPLGDIEPARIDQFLPLSVVRARLMDRYTLEDIDYATGGPARYVKVGETGGARLHHADDAQFLRELQSRAADLHRRFLHVPRPGGRGGPAHPLRATSDDFLVSLAIDRAILNKPRGHDFVIDRRRTTPAVGRHMSMTGG